MFKNIGLLILVLFLSACSSAKLLNSPSVNSYESLVQHLNVGDSVTITKADGKTYKMSIKKITETEIVGSKRVVAINEIKQIKVSEKSNAEKGVIYSVLGVALYFLLAGAL